MSHTFGIWTYVEGRGNSGLTETQVGSIRALNEYGGGYFVAAIEGDTPADLGNAHLIAAAPLLLEAAEALVAINECACPKPQDMPFDEELPPFPEWIKSNRCHWHKARTAINAAKGNQ